MCVCVRSHLNRTFCRVWARFVCYLVRFVLSIKKIPWIWNTNRVEDTRQDTSPPTDVRRKWIKSMMVLSLDGSNRLWTLWPNEWIELSCQGSCTDLFHFDVARTAESCTTTCHSLLVLIVFVCFYHDCDGVLESWRSPIKMTKYYEKQTFCTLIKSVSSNRDI